MRRFLFLVVAVLPLAAGTAACGDGLGLGSPLIAGDTSVVIATPTSATGLPTALDFSKMGLRRPEQLGDAGEWDFTLRREGDALRLVPNPFPIRSRRPLIQVSSQPFEAIDRAPTARSAYGDTAISLRAGAVYVVRSRYYPVPGGFCYGFAKMKTVELDLAEETAKFSIIANVGCADDRLAVD